MDNKKETAQEVPVREQSMGCILNKLSEGKITLNQARINLGLNSITDGDIRITKVEFDSSKEKRR